MATINDVQFQGVYRKQRPVVHITEFKFTSEAKWLYPWWNPDIYNAETLKYTKLVYLQHNVEPLNTWWRPINTYLQVTFNLDEQYKFILSNSPLCYSQSLVSKLQMIITTGESLRISVWRIELEWANKLENGQELIYYAYNFNE